MSNNWNVQSFLDQLRAAQMQPRSNEPKGPTLEKTWLNFQDNLGRYQIFPMISTVTGLPFEYLYNTREVNLDTELTDKDGNTRTSWHRLLPVDAYRFLDSTGRLVSSLTTAERELLESAYGVFDRMMASLPENSRRDIARVKNYTIGNAYVINKYGLKDQSKASRSRFSTLLICTSKDFANAINRDIEIQKINYGDDYSFLSQVYNRNLTGRTGWLIFNIQKATNRVGFSVSATHTVNLSPAATEGIIIPEEEAKLMEDPIKSFLGWQAGSEKLFNAELINKIIREMNVIISKANSTSMYVDMSQVAQATTSTSQATHHEAPRTNDPMMAAMNQGYQSGPIQTPEQMNQVNNDPFATPPAAQFDPIAQVPNNYQGGQPMQGYQQDPNMGQQAQRANYGYQQPSFAQAAPQVDNPFLNAEANPYRQQ